MICWDCGRKGSECTCDVYHYVMTGEKRNKVEVKETMVNEDKQLIAEYMGWKAYNQYPPIKYFKDPILPREPINFDPNDASLCVQWMVEKGDWEDFRQFAYTNLCRLCKGPYDNTTDLIQWFMTSNADNFFTAMATWLKGRKEK